MEIIKPGEEPKQEEKVEDQPKPFQSNIDGQGIFTMRVDLKVPIVNQEHFYIFRGFLEHNLDQAIMYIMEHRQKIDEKNRAITLMQNKENHRGFLGKILKH